MKPRSKRPSQPVARVNKQQNQKSTHAHQNTYNQTAENQ